MVFEYKTKQVFRLSLTTGRLKSSVDRVQVSITTTDSCETPRSGVIPLDVKEELGAGNSVVCLGIVNDSIEIRAEKLFMFTVPA
jgi:hypothetical protein